MCRLIISCLLLYFCCNSVIGQESSKVDSLLSFAKEQRGIKYKYGKQRPKDGFDCSGFVYYVFNKFNIPVPRASMDYEKLGKRIPIDSAAKGDIIVFTGTNYKNRFPGHVGIIISNENGEVMFIHSSSGKKQNGVVITNYTKTKSYQIRFIKLVRIKALN
jgi:lipoprotein Spr